MKYLSCYSYYGNKKRRIAAFGQEVDGELELFLLYCSPNDQFSKKKARGVFEGWMRGIMNHKYHPEYAAISLQEGESLKHSFLKYLDNRFYKRVIRSGRVIGKVIKFYPEKINFGPDKSIVVTEEYYKVNP